MYWTGWTDDPVKDAERYAAWLDERESRLPTCCICGDVIYDDDAVTDMYGDVYCSYCWDRRD